MLSSVYKYISGKVLRIVGKKAIKIGFITLISVCSPTPVITFVGIETLSAVFL